MPNRSEPSESRAWVWLLAGLTLATAAFALLTAPRQSPTVFVVVYATSFAVVLGAFMLGRRELGRLDPRALAGLLVITAAGLRAAAALAPVSLSDDVLRYVWDGRLVLDGLNPYARAPAVWTNDGTLDWGWVTRLNSAKFISLYPPLAQGLFAAVTGLADGLGASPERLLRLVLGACDLITVVALVGLLGALKERREWAALYAWNPLVYWELAGGGHTEALMAPLLVLAAWAAVRGRWLGLGLAVGFGVLAKTNALIAAPILLWHLARRFGVRRAAMSGLIVVAVVAAGYAPFWFEGLIANLRASYALYFGTFIFDSPIYAVARWALGYHEGVTADVADQVTPWLAGGLLVVVVTAALVSGGRARHLPAAVLAALVAQVLLSPVIHPWYVVPVVAIGVVARAWSPLALSFLVGLSYLAYAPGISSMAPWLLAIQFVPVAGVLGLDVGRSLLGPVLRRRARRKFRAAEAWLPPHASVLDIGAGEGFVALEAKRAGHEPVLVDVTRPDRPVGGLPFEVYDGHTLPFETASFEVGLLSYVLHHCRDPDAVLSEAARVCRRLIILESVFETSFDRRLLTFLDHLANWFRGIPVEPLHFDRVEGWRRRFETLELTPVEERWLGRLVHKHVLFVLDSAAGSTG